MEKEIEENHLLTEKESKDFKYNNRGKIVEGSYERMNSGKGNWKKYQGEAGILVNAKGVWKDNKQGISKGLEKKHKPLIIRKG